jgi:hypothetical protein
MAAIVMEFKNLTADGNLNTAGNWVLFSDHVTLAGRVPAIGDTIYFSAASTLGTIVAVAHAQDTEDGHSITATGTGGTVLFDQSRMQNGVLLGPGAGNVRVLNNFGQVGDAFLGDNVVTGRLVTATYVTTTVQDTLTNVNITASVIVTVPLVNAWTSVHVTGASSMTVNATPLSPWSDIKANNLTINADIPNQWTSVAITGNLILNNVSVNFDMKSFSGGGSLVTTANHTFW